MSPKVLILVLGIIGLTGTSRGQINPKTIYPGQNYIEDSSHIYWTWYPNPFSPPYVDPDTGIKSQYELITFYCDLPDSVTVALIDSNRSIIYSVRVGPKEKPHFSVSGYTAGQRVNPKKLPERFIQVEKRGGYGLMLLAGGRPKNIRGNPSFWLESGQYFWMQVE